MKKKSEQVKKKPKELRRGYTTGACAQAATRAAALTVAKGYVPCEKKDGEPLGDKVKTGSVEVTLPNGETAVFLVTMLAEGVCSVVKDAGDDPDITNGATIIACVTPRLDGRFVVDGAEGVGRVTQAGLAVKPGRPAINPVPLKHITEEARLVLPHGAGVTISIPGGEELAQKTFNPRLGIIGGLSVLGTTGRVEPWSARAYQESLLPQLDVALAAGVKHPVLVPGAKGEQAALREGMQRAQIVQAGNYFGLMLDAARERGFTSVTLVGHASKLAKMARGDFDTHSRRSAVPLDVLVDCAIATGFTPRRAARLVTLPTVEAAIRLLQSNGDQAPLDEAARRVAAQVKKIYGIRARVLFTDSVGSVVARA